MYKDLPLFAKDHLDYLKTIKGLSKTTIKEYAYDITKFLRFVRNRKKNLNKDYDEINDIDVSDFSINEFKKINLQDMHAYLAYTDNILGDSATTRARKVSSIKSLYNYLVKITNDLQINTADGLERPKIKKRNPVYLTLDESYKLLKTINDRQKNEFLRKRDLAIVVTFLTTGLRLSELVSINLKSIRDLTFSVVGKGNKQRQVYITESCQDVINSYLTVRPKLKDEDALFISTRNKRISNRAVQHMIEKYLYMAGFDTKVYSPHKLRHTAATLMYKEGVDIRTLQKVLGHQSVATTQIYTHVEDQDVKNAVQKNPIDFKS